MQFDFTDKIALVTGAAGNLGRAVAHALRDANAGLVLVDNRMEKLDEVFGDWADADNVWLVGTDLTSEASVNDLAQLVRNDVGRIDFLINVAGGFTMGDAVYETRLETWDFMMDLNAKSVLLTSRAFVPAMIERGGGKVVNVAARAAQQGSGKMAPYIASKAAVMRLTESLSAEVKADGINVNCIMPGTIDTPQNRESMPNADFDKWVPPAQLADVILFLCSPAATAVHGAAVPVYGLS